MSGLTEVIAWGSVPEWVEAAGTTGAFLAGLILIAREVKHLRSLEEESVREAASKIAAWWRPPAAARHFDTREWHLFVRNSSAEPVYRCTVFVGPNPDRDQLPLRLFFPVLPPESTLDERVGNSWVEFWRRYELENDGYRVEMSQEVWAESHFSDAAQRHWVRTASGEIRRVNNPLAQDATPYPDSRHPQR